MEELNLGYAEKNIGLHSKDLIKTTLVSRTEDLISRISHPSNKDRKETFGFRTTDSPPIMDELVPFEKDLINLIKNIKFKPAGNSSTNKIRSDLNAVKVCPNILVKGCRRPNR